LLPEPAASAGPEPERLLTVKQVAELLGVCPATVYRLCHSGQLPSTRLLNAIRIPRQGLLRFLADLP
jgi:excisionase family DNA binding protein